MCIRDRVTDVLISDYSGILFDYSILERPIICYAYDYDKYNRIRGSYIDIRKELVSVSNEDELVNSIKNMDVLSMNETVRKFKNKFVEKYGCSAERALDVIYKSIKM